MISKKELKILNTQLPIYGTSRSKALKGLFYVNLKPECNNKNIYEINSFLEYKVKFEPPHSKHEIP